MKHLLCAGCHVGAESLVDASALAPAQVSVGKKEDNSQVSKCVIASGNRSPEYKTERCDGERPGPQKEVTLQL